MKTGLAVALYYLGAFLALVLLISGVHGMALWSRFYDQAAAAPPFADLLPLIMRGIRPALVLGAVAAALLSLFRLLRLGGSPPVALSFLWVLLAASLLVAVAAVELPLQGREPAVQPARAPAAGVLLRSPQVALYVGRREGTQLRDVLLWRASAAQAGNRNGAAGFSVHPRASYDPVKEAIQFSTPAETVTLSKLQGGPWNIVEPPPLVSGMLNDVRRTAVPLAGLARADRLAGVFTVAALALIIVMSWVIVRLTRWPLFNAILAIGWLRLLLYLLPLALDQTMLQALGRLLPLADFPLSYLSALLLAAVGLLLLVINVVMPSFSHWKREVNGG
ncbi:MAG: hypothetical protein EA404_07410 [Spirochaetaceae bacterium]|nr:MAG: hypothetical protein EA404_07410 [Spirochaetaceae bacterium]